MRDVLEAARNGNERAKLAFEMFIHRLQTGIGTTVTSLGGLDTLVFTAGIGETVNGAALSTLANRAQTISACMAISRP